MNLIKRTITSTTAGKNPLEETEYSSSQPIGVTKIAKSVIAPLADQNISVFMLSTYQTDFILVSCDAGTPTDVNRKVFAPTPISWSAQRKVKGTLGSSVQCHMARARLWLHPLPALRVDPVWFELDTRCVCGTPSQLDFWLLNPTALPPGEQAFLIRVVELLNHV